MKNETCAYCGELKGLCRSLRINGVQQPRFCTDCIIEGIDEDKINDDFWIAQLTGRGDTESLSNILTEQS